MPIKNGDFVKINFTGKIDETGDVFDTTYEDVAKEAGIIVENKDYSPIPIVVGGNHLVPAIEEAIVGLKEGDEKEVKVSPENGFGERNPNLIQLVPMKEFKKQGIKPVPGMRITSEGQNAKVLTVSGGRVKLDFNHELAGKHLTYDVKVAEIIDDDDEKVKSMIQLHYAYPNMDIDKTEVDFDGNTVNIKLDEITRFDQKPYMDVTLARFRIAKDIWENMDVEKVQFVDTFEKKTVEPEADEEVEDAKDE